MINTNKYNSSEKTQFREIFTENKSKEIEIHNLIRKIKERKQQHI